MKHGGPAFPRPAGWNGLSNYREHSSNEPQDGMTLRDYFAALAMHAELNTAGAHEEPARCLAEEAENAGRSMEAQIAFNAYKLADAMLTERDQ